MSDSIIRISGVSKSYRPTLPTILGALLRLSGLRKEGERVRAVHALDLEIRRGETFGLIGTNGSGKTTLLRLIAGITAPDTGVIEVEGRVAALLEVGVGFHGLLTGRENVFTYGMLLGATRAEIEAAFPAIVEFAGVGDALDRPVATYSSGMFLRLGFSVAVHLRPDVLLVDETLAVGDQAFQALCLQRIDELRRGGVTVVFVSHDLSQVGAVCDRVCLIDRGVVQNVGLPDDVIADYRFIASPSAVLASAGRYTARFADGHMSIGLDGRTVTRAYGLYTSIKSLGAWHDSSTAAWQVTASDARSFTVEGRMARLPLTQTWRVTADADGVHASIELVPFRRMPVSDFHASLLLPESYDSWRAGADEGGFPDFDPAGTWRHADGFCSNAASITMFAKDGAHPTVEVTRDPELSHLLVTPLSTSATIRARAAQFLTLMAAPGAALAADERVVLFRGRISAR